jgi:hypothetical protein
MTIALRSGTLKGATGMAGKDKTVLISKIWHPPCPPHLAPGEREPHVNYPNKPVARTENAAPIPNPRAAKSIACARQRSAQRLMPAALD